MHCTGTAGVGHASRCICVPTRTRSFGGYPPPPLCKHQESQESDGQTGSWCLDKAVLAQGGGGGKGRHAPATIPATCVSGGTRDASGAGCADHRLPTGTPGALRFAKSSSDVAKLRAFAATWPTATWGQYRVPCALRAAIPTNKRMLLWWVGLMTRHANTQYRSTILFFGSLWYLRPSLTEMHPQSLVLPVYAISPRWSLGRIPGTKDASRLTSTTYRAIRQRIQSSHIRRTGGGGFCTGFISHRGLKIEHPRLLHDRTSELRIDGRRDPSTLHIYISCYEMGSGSRDKKRGCQCFWDAQWRSSVQTAPLGLVAPAQYDGMVPAPLSNTLFGSKGYTSAPLARIGCSLEGCRLTGRDSSMPFTSANTGRVPTGPGPNRHRWLRKTEIQ